MFIIFLEMSPTKGNLIKEGFTVQKQYELSMKVKVLGKVRGWTNFVHVTDGKKDCCDKGEYTILSYPPHVRAKQNMNKQMEGIYQRLTQRVVFTIWLEIYYMDGDTSSCNRALLLRGDPPSRLMEQCRQLVYSMIWHTLGFELWPRFSNSISVTIRPIFMVV